MNSIIALKVAKSNTI